MIKFFRLLRQNMITENRFSKYLLYAVGEIILVVIGILIALQINNWNNDRQTRKKEMAYLEEIQNNLKQDSKQLQIVLDFNEGKSKVVANMMQIFIDTLTNEERFTIFNENSDEFVYYQVFEPTRAAFDNMLSAESIDLVSDSELKELLTKYYTYDYMGGIQDRVIYMNRKVVDHAFPKFFTKEFIQNRMGFSSEMPSISELNIAKDQTLISDLYGIIYLIRIQNELIIETQENNRQLSNFIQEILE